MDPQAPETVNLLRAEARTGGSLAARRPKLTMAAAVITALLAWFVFQAPPAKRIGFTPVVRGILEDSALPRSGPARPEITVVVFTDYQCAVCRSDEPALAEIARQRPEVRWMFVDWPVFGPGSVLAARYALAAAEQGRYPQAHRAFMRIRGPLTTTSLDQAAQAAGVDLAALHRSLAAKPDNLQARLDRNGFYAWSLGLQGVPAYVVGPYLNIGGLDRRGLLALITRSEAEVRWDGSRRPA